MEIWHWEMRPSVVKFKPIYLPGKLVDGLFLCTQWGWRWQMHWDESHGMKFGAKQNLLQRYSLWWLLAARDKQIPVSGATARDIPAPGPLWSGRRQPIGWVTGWILGIRDERRTCHFFVKGPWNNSGCIFVARKVNEMLWFGDLFLGLVNELQ